MQFGYECRQRRELHGLVVERLRVHRDRHAQLDHLRRVNRLEAGFFLRHRHHVRVRLAEGRVHHRGTVAGVAGRAGCGSTAAQARIGPQLLPQVDQLLHRLAVRAELLVPLADRLDGQRHVHSGCAGIVGHRCRTWIRGRIGRIVVGIRLAATTPGQQEHGGWSHPVELRYHRSSSSVIDSSIAVPAPRRNPGDPVTVCFFC